MSFFSEIPKTFYNSNNESPFTHCSLCDINVIESQQLYVIEKTVKRYPTIGAQEIIMEFVICISCAMQMSESISEDSKKVLDEFQADKMNILLEEKKIVDVDKHIKEQLSQCMFSKKNISELEEYNMYCHCVADKMILEMSPMIVDTKILMEVNEKLSRKTRDDLRGYKDKIIDLPPEFKDIFKDRPILV
jgi:hypothetical protein